MTTTIILPLLVAFVWLALAFVVSRSRQNRDIEYLKERDRELRKAFNLSSKRSNEHLRAFKELADLQGYCVHETHEVKFTIASVFGDEEPEHIKKLVVHKKEEELKVEPKKTVTFRNVGKRRPQSKKK